MILISFKQFSEDILTVLFLFIVFGLGFGLIFFFGMLANGFYELPFP